VHQPIRQKGEEAARLLLRMIASPDSERPQHKTLETRLMIRDSTGPVPPPDHLRRAAGLLPGKEIRS
jgi:DNA-binding LacI/PurR family transcriptional regulator